MAISNRRKRTREYLTKEELDKLLAASREAGHSRSPARDYCMLLLMFRHRLRVSEQWLPIISFCWDSL